MPPLYQLGTQEKALLLQQAMATGEEGIRARRAAKHHQTAGDFQLRIFYSHFSSDPADVFVMTAEIAIK